MRYTEPCIRGRIFKLLNFLRIDSKESIPPAYVALRAGIRQPYTAIPTRFLAPIDCLKIPAQDAWMLAFTLLHL